MSGTETVVYDDRINTWLDVFTHPHFADGTDTQIVALYDRLQAEHGYPKASSMWRMACSYSDHLSVEHDDGECDCELKPPGGEQ